MGTKKQGITILRGSMKTHWMMYINYVHLHVNPADKVGMNHGIYMMSMLAGLKSKFLQPGFEFKHEMKAPKTFYEASIMHLKFVNGYERKYNLGISSMGMIQSDIKEINKFVAFERAFNNQDDELDDEDWDIVYLITASPE